MARRRADANGIVPKERGVGILGRAQEFINAGQQLTPVARPGMVSPPCYPAYYLHCHGIELALKAFLVTQGTSEAALHRIGHDLTAALESARGYVAFASIPMSSADAKLAKWANLNYKEKEFEYVSTGFKSLPQLTAVGSFARRLAEALETTITAVVRAELKQR